MPKLLPVFAFLATTAFAAFQPGQQSMIGVVRSDSGKPLEGVLVCSTSYKCIKTDAEGRYDLRSILVDITDPRMLRMRFSREGYNPNTLILRDWPSNLRVTLSSTNVSPWFIPACQGTERREGFNFRVLIPEGTHVAKGGDVDYGTIGVEFGSSNEWLTIGAGPTWSSGLPPLTELAASVTISDRDIRFPGSLSAKLPVIDGVDTKGNLKDGTSWRFMGNSFETLSYRNASDAAAKFFDSIIDSTCRQTSKLESKYLKAIPAKNQKSRQGQ